MKQKTMAAAMMEISMIYFLVSFLIHSNRRIPPSASAKPESVIAVETGLNLVS
jgi:hypothetical protein